MWNDQLFSQFLGLVVNFLRNIFGFAFASILDGADMLSRRLSGTFYRSRECQQSRRKTFVKRNVVYSVFFRQRKLSAEKIGLFSKINTAPTNTEQSVLILQCIECWTTMKQLARSFCKSFSWIWLLFFAVSNFWNEMMQQSLYTTWHIHDRFICTWSNRRN